MAIFYGARGAAVSAIQTQLTKAGFSTNGVDGIYGSDTEKAAQAAYRALGVPAQSGAVSEELIGALAARVGPGSSAIGATPPDATAGTQGTEVTSTWGLDFSKPSSSKIAIGLGAAALLGFVFFSKK